MTSVIRRTGLLLTAVASAAALTACGTGSSQPNAAAIIDGRSISVDEVQAVLEKVVREQPAAEPLAQQHKLDLVAREVVSQLIVHELLAEAAEEENISVDEEALDALLREGDQELPADGSVPPEQLATELVRRARDAREVAVDRVLQLQLASKYVDRLSVNMAFVAVAPSDPSAATGSLRADAEELARKFAADPDGVDEIIAESTEQGLNAQPEAEFFSALQPDLAGTVMFGSPQDSVVVFQPSPEQELWVVGKILERDEDATVPPEAQGEVEGPTLPQLEAMGKRLLQPVAEQTSITISPRYGFWDVSAMGVVPSEDERVGLVLPPAIDSQ